MFSSLNLFPSCVAPQVSVPLFVTAPGLLTALVVMVLFLSLQNFCHLSQVKKKTLKFKEEAPKLYASL